MIKLLMKNLRRVKFMNEIIKYNMNNDITVENLFIKFSKRSFSLL